LIDCEEEICVKSFAECNRVEQETQCTDGDDSEDNDGLKDCEDMDCI